MSQSRLMSLIVAITNVVVGYGIAVIAQMLVFPVFGLHTTLAQNLKMGLVFSGSAEPHRSRCADCLTRCGCEIYDPRLNAACL